MNEQELKEAMEDSSHLWREYINTYRKGIHLVRQGTINTKIAEVLLHHIYESICNQEVKYHHWRELYYSTKKKRIHQRMAELVEEERKLSKFRELRR